MPCVLLHLLIPFVPTPIAFLLWHYFMNNTIWMMKYNYEMLCQLHRLCMMLISLGTEDAYLIFPLN